MDLLTNLDLRFARGHLEIRANDKTEARGIASSAYLWANKFDQEIWIFYPSSLNPIRLLPSFQRKTMNTLSIPGLYLGNLKIYSSDFIRALLNLLERKDSDSGLVRLSDNIQVCLTQGAALNLGVPDATPYTQLKREDYWHLSDLEDFNREWRQQLREDGSNYIERTYLAVIDPINDRQQTEWGKYTSRYRLLRDGNELYHQAESLDFSPVPREAIASR